MQSEIAVVEGRVSRSSQEEVQQRVGRVGDVDVSIAVRIGGRLAGRRGSAEEEPLQGVGRIGDVDLQVAIGISAHGVDDLLRGGLDLSLIHI